MASPFAAQAIGCAEGEAVDPDALHDPSERHAGAGGKNVAAGSGGSTSLPAGGSSGMADTQSGGSANEGGNTGSGGAGNVADSGTPGSGGSAAGSAGSGGTGNMPTDAAIIVPDAPLAKGVVVFYHAGNVAPGDDTISFYLNVVNNGTTAIPLSALKIRYYFTDELNGAGKMSIYESFIVDLPKRNPARQLFAPDHQRNRHQGRLGQQLPGVHRELHGSAPAQLRSDDAGCLRSDRRPAAGRDQRLSVNLSQTAYAQTTKIVVFQGDTVVAGATPPY